MNPLSLRSMIRTSENRPRTVHQSRVLGAFLAALLGLLSRNLLAQEGRSFTDLLIAERGTTFLLFNRGDGTFIVEDYMLDDADGAAVGDFDGDGDVDIAILTGLLLGHGDFSFILVNFAREDVELCRYTDNFLEFADMDADGLMDIVLGCLDTVVIYYGTGDERIIERGTVLLSGATYRESKEGPTILAVGDMNEDGLPDLSMGQTAFGTQFFLNQGGRSYKPLSDELPLGHLLTSHDGLERWIDFNGDGHLDIISPYGVFLGDGKLGFTKVEYPKDVGPINRPEIVDIDGDRELDIVSLGASFWPVEGPDTLKAAAISILGRGDGTFREVRRSTSLPSSLEVPDSRWPIVVRFYDFTTGDFNGDGAVDMALVIGRNSQFEGYICEGVLWILGFTRGLAMPGASSTWATSTASSCGGMPVMTGGSTSPTRWSSSWRSSRAGASTAARLSMPTMIVTST
jgi:hypothetical protein